MFSLMCFLRKMMCLIGAPRKICSYLHSYSSFRGSPVDFNSKFELYNIFIHEH